MKNWRYYKTSSTITYWELLVCHVLVSRLLVFLWQELDIFWATWGTIGSKIVRWKPRNVFNYNTKLHRNWHPKTLHNTASVGSNLGEAIWNWADKTSFISKTKSRTDVITEFQWRKTSGDEKFILQHDDGLFENLIHKLDTFHDHSGILLQWSVVRACSATSECEKEF